MIPSAVKNEVLMMYRSGKTFIEIKRVYQLSDKALKTICLHNENVGKVTTAFRRTGKFIPLQDITLAKRAAEPKPEPQVKLAQVREYKRRGKDPNDKQYIKWADAGFLSHKTKKINIERAKRNLPPITLALKPRPGFIPMTAQQVSDYEILTEVPKVVKQKPIPKSVMKVMKDVEIITKAAKAPVIPLHQNDLNSIEKGIDAVIEKLQALKEGISKKRIKNQSRPQSRGF